MSPLIVVLVLTAFWLAYLVVERVRLDRDRKAVPLHIAVTGTRGKTSVTRRLAAVLEEDGRRVLAKTTGSEAAYILPGGTVQEVRRLGLPSIIEQKRLLRKAAWAGADVVLAEVMSLHRENHRVEVHEILQPSLVLVTNFRVDHVEAHGNTREEVASILALDVPPGATGLVPESEWEDGFAHLVSGTGGTVLKVPTGEGTPSGRSGEFGANVDLVWAASRHLGVADPVIDAGLRKVRDDLGALACWAFSASVLVNAFAANDPESTLRIYERTVTGRGVSPEDCTGLLSLRSDRGDRSLQWVEALERGALSRFGRLFVSGFHARAVRFALRRHPEAWKVEILRPGPPEGIMAQLLGEGGASDQPTDGPAGRVVFGFGNIEGLGRTMVEHWRKVGEPYGI
ncbi:MAG: hypothetical protein HKO65_03730 [Gemmatimonadetes bacterium]|nr:hypothetical protein [Gemmatimonadota bacterium]